MFVYIACIQRHIYMHVYILYSIIHTFCPLILTVQRGDLFVSIDVVFPAAIPECDHASLVSMLGQPSEQTAYNGHEAAFVRRP